MIRCGKMEGLPVHRPDGLRGNHSEHLPLLPAVYYFVFKANSPLLLLKYYPIDLLDPLTFGVGAIAAATERQSDVSLCPPMVASPLLVSVRKPNRGRTGSRCIEDSRSENCNGTAISRSTIRHVENKKKASFFFSRSRVMPCLDSGWTLDRAVSRNHPPQLKDHSFGFSPCVKAPHLSISIHIHPSSFISSLSPSISNYSPHLLRLLRRPPGLCPTQLRRRRLLHGPLALADGTGARHSFGAEVRAVVAAGGAARDALVDPAHKASDIRTVHIIYTIGSELSMTNGKACIVLAGGGLAGALGGEQAGGGLLGALRVLGGHNDAAVFTGLDANGLHTVNSSPSSPVTSVFLVESENRDRTFELAKPAYYKSPNPSAIGNLFKCFVRQSVSCKLTLRACRLVRFKGSRENSAPPPVVRFTRKAFCVPVESYQFESSNSIFPHATE